MTVRELSKYTHIEGHDLRASLAELVARRRIVSRKQGKALRYATVGR